MIKLQNILVPTDFSECSDAALRYGLELARAFNANLHVLHVVQDPYTQPWAAEAFPAAIGDLLTDWQKQSEKRLLESIPVADRRRVKVSCSIASPYGEILRYAVNDKIDLIVMGTHGRGPLAHMLLGSVAEKVVRRAPCPVLTVRHPQHDFVDESQFATTASGASR
jgi:nucleotide-binding universal stress UspA family protein